MRTDVMIKQLRNVAKKHENDKLYTCDTNISQMCTDVANRLEELEKENKEIRNTAISEFAERIKTSQNAHIWCCRDTMMEMCSGDDCESCLNQFKEQIDEIAEKMRGAE